LSAEVSAIATTFTVLLFIFNGFCLLEIKVAETGKKAANTAAPVEFLIKLRLSVTIAVKF
jgi:hypothetical protein